MLQIENNSVNNPRWRHSDASAIYSIDKFQRDVTTRGGSAATFRVEKKMTNSTGVNFIILLFILLWGSGNINRRCQAYKSYMAKIVAESGKQ